MKCDVCGREGKSRFCEFHRKAYENLVEKYDVWKRALEMTWTEYLNEISRNPNAGLWAKEVAKQLLVHESSEE